MLIRCRLTFLDVQRVLESYLLIGSLPIVLGNGLLKGLEVEEIERIAERGKEFLNALLIYTLCLVQRTLHLHLLFVAQLHLAQIIKSDTTSFVVLQFFREIHAIEVEDGGLVFRYAVLLLAVFYYWPADRLPRAVVSVLRTVSTYTMGVYCIHLLLGTIVSEFILPSLGIAEKSMSCAVFVYCLSWAACLLLAKIPYVEKLVK